MVADGNDGIYTLDLGHRDTAMPRNHGGENCAVKSRRWPQKGGRDGAEAVPLPPLHLGQTRDGQGHSRGGAGPTARRPVGCGALQLRRSWDIVHFFGRRCPGFSRVKAGKRHSWPSELKKVSGGELSHISHTTELCETEAPKVARQDLAAVDYEMRIRGRAPPATTVR